jgi:hypothetical protein
MRIERFEDIEAWQLARELTRKLYRLTKKPEFIRFLRYSKRSCSEVQSELYIALDENYISSDEFKETYELAGQTRATVRGFINYLIKYEECRNINRER